MWNKSLKVTRNKLKWPTWISLKKILNCLTSDRLLMTMPKALFGFYCWATIKRGNSNSVTCMSKQKLVNMTASYVFLIMVFTHYIQIHSSSKWDELIAIKFLPLYVIIKVWRILTFDVSQGQSFPC